MRKEGIVLLVAVGAIVSIVAVVLLQVKNSSLEGLAFGTPGCTDTDGGLSYKKAGTVTLQKNNSKYSDYCLDKNTVNEYVCGSLSVLQKQYPCKAIGLSCNNGKCS